VIGPGGRLSDPATDLSATTPDPAFGGTIDDDFDGLGPEIALIPELPDGVYGVVVAPVFDDQDPGSNAILRLLGDGRPLMRGLMGPRFLSAVDGSLWIVGKLSVSDGLASWESIDELLDGSMAPTAPPSAWPDSYFL
jgi:hypothetical protein